MQAKLYRINKNGIWLAVLKKQDDLFKDQDIITDDYAINYGKQIYNFGDLDPEYISTFKNNLDIEGEIKDNKFLIKGSIYKNTQKEIKKEEFKSIFYVKSLLNGYQKVAIKENQYKKIEILAKEENTITAYFSNGFCLNYKYVIYGRLTNKGTIKFPQIKIK